MAGDKAKVHVIEPTSGKKYTVLIPTNAQTKQVLPALVKQMGLPTEGLGGAPMRYHLALETGEGNVQLGEDETLREAHVQDGAVLRITPEMRAGLQEVDNALF